MRGFLKKLPQKEADAPVQFTATQLTAHQQPVADGIYERFVEHRAPRTILAGGAGVGKTTVAGAVARKVFDRHPDARIAYVAPTAQAASVLKRSLAARGVRPGFCGTIHSLIYKPDIDGDTILGWTARTDVAESFDYIVADEASMISEALAGDLEAFGLPVLYMGDNFQLAPIDGDGIMGESDFVLTEIMRQAKENPVIELAHMVRTQQNWRKWLRNQDKIKVVSSLASGKFVADALQTSGEDPLLIVRTNAERVEWNNVCRNVLGIESPTPAPGDKIVVLKNAYRGPRNIVLANGWRGTVSAVRQSSRDDLIGMDVGFQGEGVSYMQGEYALQQFGQPSTLGGFKGVILADFAYAMTCHKLQGSQAGHVIVKPSRGGYDTDEDVARWMNTAVTRTTDRLTIII